MDEKYIEGNLRNLLRMCCLDFEQPISKSELETVLPIEQDGIKVWFDDKKLNFTINDDISFCIFGQDDMYNKIMILKRVLFKFNIFLTGDSEYERTKFQNEILMLLTK